MIRARYSDLKAAIARVAGVSGMQVTDARVLSYTNSAIQELMDEGDWPSLIARLQFSVTKARIVIPSEFDRMLYCTINNSPMPMQSPWFEFVGDGPGFLNSPYGIPVNDPNITNRFVGVLDRDQIFTFEDVPNDGTIYYPVIYGTVDERTPGSLTRPTLVLQGYDQNNHWIRTQSVTGQWIDGMELPINGDTPPYATQGTVAIKTVAGIQKPVTNGYVELYASNGTNNVYLGRYAPYDTLPFYRSYNIPGINTGTAYCMLARCRRRFRPIVNDADFLLISNVNALVTMVQALYYREAKDLASYAQYKASAIEILQREARSYIGLQRQKPFISFGEGTGVRRDGLYIL